MATVFQCRGWLAQYLAELRLALDVTGLAMSAEQKVAAIGWIERGDQVLMVRRQQEPFTDRWTAPGGKLELGETPPAALVREMGEETGWLIRQFQLRLITSETGAPGYNWVTFVFHCPVNGDPSIRHFRPEGVLEWVPLAELPFRRIPSVDRLLLPYIFPGRWSLPQVMAAGMTAEPTSMSQLASVWRRAWPPPDRDQIYFAQIGYGPGARVDSVQLRALAPGGCPVAAEA